MKIDTQDLIQLWPSSVCESSARPLHPSCSFPSSILSPSLIPSFSLLLLYRGRVEVLSCSGRLLNKYMTLVSPSHHYLGPNACPSSPDGVYVVHTLCGHMFKATAGLVLMGDSPFPNMQSHVLSPFNCLSQRVYSLFNFLGIMKQLSMYP